MRPWFESDCPVLWWEYETFNWLQKTRTGQFGVFIALLGFQSKHFKILRWPIHTGRQCLNKISRDCLWFGRWSHGSFWVFLTAKSYEDKESFSKFYGIAFSHEEREVPWIIIKGLLARSLDTSQCDHRFLYDPIPSVRGGLTKTDYHLIASPKTNFQCFLQHNYFSYLWSTT